MTNAGRVLSAMVLKDMSSVDYRQRFGLDVSRIWELDFTCITPTQLI